jgi:phosphatidylserine synthase
MEVYKKIFIFLSGYIVGFVTTTIIKWTLSIYFFGAEVRETIGAALKVRLSAGTDGLNGPLLDYSSTFSGVPVPIRAIFLNAMVFASKIIDPRNASTLGIVVIFLLFLFIFFKFVNTYKPTKIIGKRNFLAFIPVFLIPYIYILSTANHSFNHAVLIYRAIPVSVGFLLSLIYIMHAQNEVFLSTNLNKSED